MTAEKKDKTMNSENEDLNLQAQADDSMPADISAEPEPVEEEALPVDIAVESEPVEEEVLLDDVQVETSEEPVDKKPVAAPKAPAKEEPADDSRQWFVIHCYSGYENKVRKNLEQRIETMSMRDKIFDVVIPTQEEIEVRDGRRRTVERYVFPGYLLVNMVLEEESWFVVRNTPGVTGFVGMGEEPTPLRPEEVAQILRRMEDEVPTYKVTYKPGERVRIVDGPFNDFRGTVSDIDMERSKIRVMVNFFGRETPVELDFLQVEKA